MAGVDNEVKLGDGKSPDGAAVSYFEVDRPESVGAKGSQGYVIEVRDAKGARITHSDSMAGLQKAGYTMGAPKVDAPKVEPKPKTPVTPPAPEKTIEDELGA